MVRHRGSFRSGTAGGVLLGPERRCQIRGSLLVSQKRAASVVRQRDASRSAQGNPMVRPKRQHLQRAHRRRLAQLGAVSVAGLAEGVLPSPRQFHGDATRDSVCSGATGGVLLGTGQRCQIWGSPLARPIEAAFAVGQREAPCYAQGSVFRCGRGGSYARPGEGLW